MRVTEEWLRANYRGADALLASLRPKPPGPVPDLPGSRALVSGPPRWVVEVDNWRPASDNLRAESVKRWAAAKKTDKRVIRDFVLPHVPVACGRRRVALTVVKKTRRKLDPANLLKSFHDALVSAGLIVDDCPERLAATIPEIVVDKGLQMRVKSIIVLEDLDGCTSEAQDVRTDSRVALPASGLPARE